MERPEEVSTAGRPQHEPPSWWVPLVEFGVHVLVGTGLFLIIAIPAVGLDLLLKWLKTLGVSNIILIVLTTGEVALAGMDLILFLVFLANVSWKFLKSLKWRMNDERNKVKTSNF